MEHGESGGEEVTAARAEGTNPVAAPSSAATATPTSGPAAAPSSGSAPAHSRGNVFEHTIAALLRAIRLGQYLVGDKLPAERDLAARIKVSRATLRQALSELQTAGIVTVRRGRYGGTFVTRLPSAGDDATEGSIDPAELDDAVRFRHVLETAAARIVASRTLQSAEVEALTTAESECREVFGAPGESAEKFRALDARFHLSIAELTRIPSLVAASASTRDRINALLDRIPFIETNVEHSCAQHGEILDAVLAGDPDLAAELAAQHAEGTEQLLRGFLEHQ